MAKQSLVKKVVVASLDHPPIAPPEPSIVPTGQVFSPDRPTAANWTFVDWYKDDQGTSVFNSAGEVIPPGNTDLWGKWTEGEPIPTNVIKVNYKWGSPPGPEPPDPGEVTVSFAWGSRSDSQNKLKNTNVKSRVNRKVLAR
jgi:hypothetical protein